MAADRLSERDARDVSAARRTRLPGFHLAGGNKLEATLARTLVYVIDASSLINIKRHVTAAHQWNFFNETLTEMVNRGDLLIVPQVETECGYGEHPDVPGAWVLAKASSFAGVREPSEHTVRKVLDRWPRLVNCDKEREDADPYVVARALELQKARVKVCVVTDDVLNHPPTTVSIANACKDLGIYWTRLAGFLGPKHLDIPRSCLTSEGRRAAKRSAESQDTPSI